VRVYRGLTEIPDFAPHTSHLALKQRAVTIGVFDGLHMGHRALIGRLISEARNRSLTATVITFANHPQSVLSPPSPPLLTTVEERLELLAELGVDETVVLPFTIELSRLTAEQFCREILVGKLACKLLVVGDDFALGYRREGTVAKLKELGAQLGFEVIVVSPVTSEGIRVSSSEIRQLLLQGDVERANELLGKPYRIVGDVVKGAGRGRKLGFPTINLKVEPEKLLPRFGVYAGKVSVAQSDKTNFALPTPHPPQHSFDAAAYIGQRPTFGETEPAVEAYLLDFNGVVPEGTKVTLELVAFIRPDQKFDSADALIEQMNRDVQAVREKLKART
jgi:riboflavin kinase / FMN adenylyltransferase